MGNQQNNSGVLILLVIVAAMWFSGRIGPTPGPAPPNPEPPAPISDLAAKVRAIVQRLVPAPARAADSRSVAAALRDVAGDVERLRDPLHRSQIKRPQDVVIVANQRIDAALGLRASDWSAARAEIAAELALRQAAGQIGLSVYDVGAALAEVAKGIDP